MMSYIVHYIHSNKLWYYWTDEYKCKKNIGENWKDLLLTKDIITKRQCKKRLQTMFRNYRIMKAHPFHHSPRYGSNGSRMVKCTVDRKGMLKEKIKLKEQ